MARLKFTNLTSGKQGLTRPQVGVLEPFASKTLDGVLLSDLTDNTELSKLLLAGKISIQSMNDPAVSDAVEGRLLPATAPEAGDGSDGDATIVGSILLTQNKYYNNLTIAVGGVLDPAAYQIFAKNTFTNNGTLRNNGSNASGNLGSGASGAPGSGFLPIYTIFAPPTQSTSGAGGFGSTNAGGSAYPMDLGSGLTVALGGGGGGGGAGPSGAGGQAGFVDLESDKPVRPRSMLHAFSVASSYESTLGLFTTWAGGSGGGGGGGGGAGNIGGGGGGGGGVVPVCATNIINNGVIEAKGGNGDTGNGTNSGGGGGGGGGAIILAYRSLTGTGTMSVAAGLGGAKVGTGVNGVDGTVGTIYQFQL